MGRLGLIFLSTIYAFAALAEEPRHVVEMFTSKFCPNCPAAEKKMVGVAAQNTDLLILFAHVDYWDRGDQKDPLGLAEVTERQYDYSNKLSARPGQVFTPMPVIDGKFVASPPLWLSLEGQLKAARAAGALAKISVAKQGSELVVELGKSYAGGDYDVQLLGLDKAEDGQVREVMSLSSLEARKATLTVPKALMPKADEALVLVQEKDAGAVVAFGLARLR